MLKNTSTNYGGLAKFFHWFMACLFIGMFIIAYIMINISKTEFRDNLYLIHKSTGLLLFCLVALRLTWRLVNAQPELPSFVPAWQRYSAKVNIFILYFIMFAFPITGFLTSTLGNHIVSFFGLFIIQPLANNKAASELFSKAHEIFAYLLMVTFSLHLLAAFYHHYFLKDDVLRKIWLRPKKQNVT